MADVVTPLCPNVDRVESALDVIAADIANGKIVGLVVVGFDDEGSKCYRSFGKVRVDQLCWAGADLTRRAFADRNGASMRTTLVWDKHRMAASVRNDSDGPPWLGVVRCEPLVDDQWKATTTIYEKPVDLGLFATTEDARDALVAEAEARAARIEHAKRAHLTSFRSAA